MTVHQSTSSNQNKVMQHEMMRCVINGQGEIIFASPALIWTLGGITSDIIASEVGNFLHVLSGENNVPSDITKITSGFYETSLQRKNRDPLVLDSRIDNIRLPDGRHYVVFWLDPNHGISTISNDSEQSENYASTAYELASIANKFVKNQQYVSLEAQADLLKQTSNLSMTNLGTISNDDGELRHFLNLSNDLLAVYRKDSSFVRVNYAFNRILGYEDEDLKQIPFIDLIHPEDREFVCIEMNKLMGLNESKEKRLDFQCRARCKDGGYRWIDWIQKSSGDHIYIIGSDVTGRKQHEAELQYREKQLSEAQKIGRMGHWYWVVRDDHIDWSDNLFNIFGVKKSEFEPSINNLRGLMGKKDANKIIQSFRKSIMNAIDCVLEFKINVKNNEVRYIRCEGRCKIEETTGKVKALFGIMQDITENKQHEEALHQAKNAAETAYASKTRFLANMSHELRTPLNAIIGFSEMMQQQLLGPVGNERYLDYISGIHESGEHLLNLINDILDMSKIEVGKYELEIEEFNLTKLIQLAIHMVETRANDGNIRLLAPDLPENLTIKADRRAIMQVVLNLLSNAVKFTPDNGEVSISCNKIDDEIHLSISDTGVGIPEEKIDLVVLPFEQVSSAMTRDHEGTGLGLAITQDLVKLHEGKLTIKSIVGTGTTVTVILPQTF